MRPARYPPGPWFRGDWEERTCSVGGYDLSDRPNKPSHYEDTYVEVWDVESDGVAVAALVCQAACLDEILEQILTEYGTVGFISPATLARAGEIQRAVRDYPEEEVPS